jgi:predicted branched-subunit amino acid permease
VLPWDMLFGSLAVQRGFSWIEAQMFSAVIYGGAVQIVTVELMADDAPLFTILFSALVISSWHSLYGLTLREKIKI